MTLCINTSDLFGSYGGESREHLPLVDRK